MFILAKDISGQIRVETVFFSEVPEGIEGAIHIDGELPLPENIIGKASILCVNAQNELYYEYEDRELTLEEKVLLMQKAIDDLILGGAL